MVFRERQDATRDRLKWIWAIMRWRSHGIAFAKRCASWSWRLRGRLAEVDGWCWASSSSSVVDAHQPMTHHPLMSTSFAGALGSLAHPGVVGSLRVAARWRR